MGWFSKKTKEDISPLYKMGDQVYFPIDGKYDCHEFVLGEIKGRIHFTRGWYYLVQKFPYNPNANETLIEVEEHFLYPKTTN